LVKLDFGTKNILITGANGWLGKNLIFSLINGIKSCDDLGYPSKALKIKCMIMPNENYKNSILINDNIEIVIGDLRKIEDCQYFTSSSKNAILFHCGGVIHPPSTKYFYDINVQGTKNLLNAAVENRVKKVIAISSNSAFDINLKNNELFDERSDYIPYLKYGKSKMFMEKIIKDYTQKGMIESIIIRPPWFYGPNQPQRQNKFYKMVKRGKVPIVGDGENKRSVACTINICQALIRSAINVNIVNGTYWIADERLYTFNEILSTVQKVYEQEYNIKCQPNNIRLPNIVSDFAYFIDATLQSLGLYNKEIHVLSEMNKNIACSISKAKADLGYSPTIDLYEGTYLSLKSIVNEFR
tara:strand:- start:517 stop:1581 length:1065 start_codon:yes stop_codon:yes gene_type:complete